MCGEKKVMRGGKDKRMGSPPHVRGKVPQHEQHDKGHGITPACAGKSLPAMLTTSGDRDHPRMCGEKMLTGDTTDEETGSPPHVRGKGPTGQRP